MFNIAFCQLSYEIFSYDHDVTENRKKVIDAVLKRKTA